MEGVHIIRPFTIDVNGQCVINPPRAAREDAQIPFMVGDREDAAIFKLYDGYLTSNYHIMGHFHAEPSDFIAMGVYWFPKEARSIVQPCFMSGNEDEPKILTQGL